MEIVCCRLIDEAAKKAFQLRYEVYGAEMGLQDGAIDHQRAVERDPVRLSPPAASSEVP